MSDTSILSFEPSFFETEIREGYTVEKLTKHAWAAEMEVLAEIDRICKKYDIRYFAEWGTLLGAVRHKGFIPWDDDLDIAMFREDLMRFLQVAPGELPSGSVIVSPYSRTTEFSEVVRVSDSEWINIGEAFNEKYHRFPFAAGIDIFPYDYIPRDRVQQDQQIELLKAVGQAATAYLTPELSSRDKRTYLLRAKQLTGVDFTEDDTVINQLSRAMDAICALYKRGDSNLVGITYRMMYDRDREPKPVEWFAEMTELEFENIKIPAPKGYDKLLKKRYGDYHTPMMVPDHDYPFYASQIKVFNKYLKDNGMTYDPLYTMDRQSARLKEALER